MNIHEALNEKTFELPPIAGHNNPPSSIELAQDTIHDLADFLESTPVIETPEHATQAGLFIERTRKVLADVEDERDRQVRPLNETVAAINEKYHAVHNENKKKPGSADRLLAQLQTRLTAYLQAEEDKRLAEAEAKRRAAEEAERLAREAEAREREAIENAKLGELTDVGAAVQEADASFKTFEKANREAARAEREATVRIGSALGGNALSMRNHETLIIESVNKAIIAMGATPKIQEAILSSARDYRKLHGQLPPGIRAETSRSL